jgi:hypothetical protein
MRVAVAERKLFLCFFRFLGFMQPGAQPAWGAWRVLLAVAATVTSPLFGAIAGFRQSTSEGLMTFERA